MKRAVIVVAGGSGKRMGGDMPKQFLPVGGKPILMHTLNNLYSFDKDMLIVLVMVADCIDLWKKLCSDFAFDVPHVLVKGGKERFDSVKNGLLSIPEEMVDDIDVVAVHDGVRPFLTNSLLSSLFDVASKGKAVIPVVPMIDSIRKYEDTNNSIAVDRKKYCRVQTPQCFPFKKLLNAYNATLFSIEITDDASVWEHYSIDDKITLVLGDESNIKITNPIDMAVAERLLQNI